MNRIVILSAFILLQTFTFPLLGQKSKGKTNIDRSKAPAAGPAPQILIGDPVSFELDNGLKVFIVENNNIPRISWRLFVDYGEVLEKDKAGFSDIFSEAFSSGTTTKSKQEIDENIDFIGATMSFGSKGFFASSITKHKDKLLDILSDVFFNPSFPEEEVEKIKRRTLSGLETAKSDANSMAQNAASQAKYGENHPYGEVASEKTIQNISGEDLKNFHQHYFKPNISYLIVVGDINVEEAKKDINRVFGTWKKGTVERKDYAEPSLPKGNKVVFVEKPGAVQSVINVTFPVKLQPGHPDVIAASVMNGILGGGVFSGRLMQNLREDKAYTYGMRSSLSSDELIGSFSASGSFRNEVTDSAITEIFHELRRIVDEPVTKEELEITLSSMNGSFSRSLENPQTIASFALNQARYNLPDDYYKNYLERLSKVTITDIQRVAEMYIKPDNSYIVVVGNKDIKEKIKSFSYDDKIDERDYLGNPKKDMLPMPEGISSDDIISNYIHKIFMTDNKKKINKTIKKIKTITTESSAEIQGMQLDFTMYKQAPNKFAMEIKMQGNTMQRQYFNGETGGSSGMMGVSEMGEDEIKSSKITSLMFPETQYQEMGVTLKALGIETIDDKKYYVVEETINDQLTTAWYNVESGLKYKTSSVQESQEGSQILVNHFENYKEVDGILFPHTISNTIGGQTFKLEVKKIEINSKIEDTVFEK